MPNYASSAWDWANKPLVPPSETVDQLAQPGLNDSPAWARVKGFGSGALEGLRHQTSPLNIANIATMGMGGGAGTAVKGAVRGAEAAPEILQGLRGASQGFKGLKSAAAPAARTLGEMAPDFTAVGGEAAFNAGRTAAGAAHPGEAAMAQMLGKPGSVADEAARDAWALRNNKPPSVFENMRNAGEFRGDRSVRGIGNLQEEAPGGLSSAMQILKERGRR